jgi:ubiquinone/menaquinone biosynthesis C-methylase UbiE
MAEESLLLAWWKRLRGELEPKPFPFADAAVLEMPLRRLVAGPERILGAFGIGRGERVLEVGPGIGYYSADAARRVGREGRLFCLDVQREMLGAVRTKVAVGGGEALLIQGSATQLPLATGSVDHVFFIAVLGEVPDHPRALAEVRRVLRPGGRLSVAELFPDPDFVTKTTLRRELTAAGFAEQSTRGNLFYTSTWRSTGGADA